jgi:ComF family protein
MLPEARGRCPECGLGSVAGYVHERCRKKAVIVRLISGYSYKDRRLARLIWKIKYQLAREIIDDLVDKLDLNVDNEWIIVPIPLHNRRLNWRGFNQAEELGKLLATKYNLSLVKALKRVKNTKKLADIKQKHKRKAEITGAFQVVDEVRDKKILLVDDVFTSGSTMKEAAFELKKAGAGDIWAVTLAS